MLEIYVFVMLMLADVYAGHIYIYFFSLYFQALKVEDLGVVDFEQEKERRNKPIFVPSWFTVDLKTGVRFMFLVPNISLIFSLLYFVCMF